MESVPPSSVSITTNPNPRLSLVRGSRTNEQEKTLPYFANLLLSSLSSVEVERHATYKVQLPDGGGSLAGLFDLSLDLDLSLRGDLESREDTGDLLRPGGGGGGESLYSRSLGAGEPSL